MWQRGTLNLSWLPVLILAVSLLTACGRMGPPLPPEEQPTQEGAPPEPETEEEKEKPPTPQVFDPQQY